jgi:hypothetical protein
MASHEPDDWTARHARTRPSEGTKRVRQPATGGDDWKLRHTETSR